jgi:hypothetical protein
MRRPALIATLLLPLPFAALPLISLVLSGGDSHANDEYTLASNTPALDTPISGQFDTPLASSTFVDPVHLSGCGGLGLGFPIEG